MKKKPQKQGRKQAQKQVLATDPTQLLLPMVVGILATKQNLEAWVHEQGMAVLRQLFSTDAEQIAGKKAL